MGIFDRVIILLTIIVSVCMLLAGAWLTHYLRQSDIRSAARMAAGYFQLTLGNTADAPGSPPLPAANLRGMVVPPGRIEAVVFWRPDGTIQSSSDPVQAGERHDNPNLDRVLREGILSDIVQGRSYADGSAEPLDPAQPLLEIYVPLDPGPDGRPQLIGEIYLDARALLVAEAQRAGMVWIGVALTGGTILSLLLYTLIRARRVVVAQQVELDARLTHTEKLLAINRALRSDADTARDDLIHGNEAVLNALAADLHDGPLQMLAAAALSLGDAAQTEERRSIGTLLSRAMRELRDLSSGLGLPELASLNTHDTILLAVQRHAAMTGSDVICHIPAALPDLDTATQICLFRVLQEGLTNAFKHGHDTAPHLHVRLRGAGLVAAVASRTQADAPRPELRLRAARGGLGLPGIRRRVMALGGTMRQRRHPAGHVLMLVRLPLR